MRNPIFVSWKPVIWHRAYICTVLEYCSVADYDSKQKYFLGCECYFVSVHWYWICFPQAENNKILEMVTALPFFFLSLTECTESQNIDVVPHKEAGQHVPVSSIMNEWHRAKKILAEGI